MKIKKDYILKVSYDDSCFSPREGIDSVGFFLTQSRNHISPDKNEDLQDIIKMAYNEDPKDVADHIKIIKRLYKENFKENLVLIVPISKYEHGSIRYYIGDHSVCRWDSGIAGFYIITKESLKKCYESKRPQNKTLLKEIENELDTYNSWANGEIYRYELSQKQTIAVDNKEYTRVEFVDSCSGFYDLEEIKKDLPAEFKGKNLVDYIIY